MDDASAPFRVFAAYWGRRGGGARYALGMSHALAELPGIALSTSFSTNADDLSAFRALPGRQLPIPTFARSRDAPAAALRLPAVHAALAREMADWRPHVVVSYMFHPWNEVLRRAARRAQVPVVASVHDASVHPGDGGRLLGALVRRDIAGAEAVLTLSDAVQRAVVESGLQPWERTAVLPLGPHAAVSVDRSARRLPVGRPVRLLFCGRIRQYKGLELLRDAYRLLLDRGLPLQLMIAGAGGGLPSFSGLNGVTVRNTWLTDVEMSELFEQADVLVLPYLEASQSGVVTIAQAYGVPVVVTPVGGLPEQIGHGAQGAVAAAVDAKAFADAVHTLIRDPDHYLSASEHGLAHARGAGSWQVAARRCEQSLRRFAALRRGA